MDHIFITGLTTTAQIGVYDWEQQIRQKVIFDLEMAWDCSKAAETDDVQFCLNYAEVSQAIITFCQEQAFYLVEKLAHETAMMLLRRFNIPWLKLTLHKPNAIPDAQSVGITIERTHPDFRS